MKKFCRAVAVLFSVLPATTAFGQAVTFTWPLTTNTSGTPVPAGNIAAPEIIAGSPCTAMVQGYIGGGVGQKLWNGTTGWLPETASNPNRCIQFDATPASGTQMTVTNLTFLYGFSGIGSKMRSNVFYSVGGSTWTPIPGNPLVYGVQSMVQSNTTLSVPVPAGQTFSVRIFPWSMLHSVGMTPWFAVHRSVTISALSTPGGGGGASNRLDIYKKLNASVATPGTYQFNVTCAPLPFTGTNPVNVVYPNPGMTTVNVPAGETCNVTEVQPTTGSWSTPSFAASAGLNVTGSGWGASVGPVNANGKLFVTNNPGTGGGSSNRLDIYKKLNASVATPGTYNFNVTCAPLPFTGTNPVNVVYPNPGMATVNVPAGETCNVTEVQPTTGSWSTPSFAASAGLNVTGSGWGASVGPVNANGKLFVTNNPAAQHDVKITTTTMFPVVHLSGPTLHVAIFNFQVDNVGPGSVGPGEVTVTFTLPTGWSPQVGQNSITWGCSTGNPLISCIYQPPGPVITLGQGFPNFQWMTHPSGPGTSLICADVQYTSGTDSHPLDNHSCVTVVVVP